MMKKKISIFGAGIMLVGSMFMFSIDANATKDEPCEWGDCEIVGLGCEGAGNYCLVIS